MRPFWVPSRRRAEELELDRCSDCGGVWFDAGELTQASGRTVKASREATDRDCPGCGVTLVRGTMSGEVDVETCPRCRGTFLEARDLDALMEKAPRKSAPGGSGFVCDACGQRRPFSHAQATLTGLECHECAARAAEPAPSAEARAPSRFGGFMAWLRGE